MRKLSVESPSRLNPPRNKLDSNNTGLCLLNKGFIVRFLNGEACVCLESLPHPTSVSRAGIILSVLLLLFSLGLKDELTQFWRSKVKVTVTEML